MEFSHLTIAVIGLLTGLAIGVGINANSHCKSIVNDLGYTEAKTMVLDGNCYVINQDNDLVYWSNLVKVE